MAPQTLKKERLEARVTPETKRIIARAADIRGTTVTEFVVASAQEAATQIIKDAEVITLDREASILFVNTLLNPPAPNDKLRAAARRYKTLTGR